ncbi:MAG: DUF3987 domain-containing protein, partial [Lentisphaerae bacterium]|nr:DUF3987 domain-containing protein [Lentisphaerota bacterium]
LVPRLLIAEMPKRLRRWSDTETTEKDTKVWHDAVLWLRTRPFADFDSNTGCYRPHVLGLSDEAKKAYVTFFNALAERSYAADERAALFIDKARGLTLRLALVRHGLGAAVEECNINGDVSLQVMKDAIELTRYFLGEQLRVYGLTTGQFEGDRVQDVVAWLHKRGGGATSREFHRSHTGRYSTAKEATADLQLVVDAGSARWEGKTCMLC